MEDEISLSAYVESIWRAKWLILAASILAGGAVAYYRYRQPAVYTSQVLLQVGRVWKEPIEDPYLTAELINSPGFLSQLAPKLGTKPGMVRRSVHATTITAGAQKSGYPILVSVTATGNSSSESAAFAKVTAEEVIARHDLSFDQSMKPHLDYQRQLEALLAPTGVLSVDRGKPSGSRPGGGASVEGTSAAALAAPNAPALSEALSKTLHDYDEVRSFNESPAITQKTRMISEAAPGAYSRVSIGSPAAIAAVLAALVCCAAAIALELLRNAPRTSRELSAQKTQEVVDASIS